MSETRTYQGHTYTREGPGQPWVLSGAAGPQPVTVGTPSQTRITRDQAEAARAQAEAAQAQAETPYAGQVAEAQAAKAGAEATKATAETAAIAEEQATDEGKRQRKSIADRMKYGNVMDSIRAARAIARQGGTGWGSLLSGLPESYATALESAIAPLKGNLSFDRLQEMRADPDNKTGGAVGSVSEQELALLGSTVASLDTKVKVDQFLANLDRIERHFVGSQLALSGIDPYGDEGRAAFKQFGVMLPEQKTAQAGIGDSTQASQTIPAAMQAEHQALLDAWLQAPDPDRYAQMRTELDQKYGFPSDYARHRAWAADVAIPALREGKTIGPAIPPPEAPLEGLGWLMNAATAEPTGTGAFFASMGNAGALGIPSLMGGQDRMEALRGQSPVASFLGETAGAITGTAMTGGAMGLAGKAAGNARVAQLLANPATADAVYGGLYGATQAEDPVYGALGGAAAGLAGNKIGGAVARELPGLVGLGGAVRRADEAVPTIPDLKQEAASLYTAAEANGAPVDPSATTQIFNDARQILSREGQVRPDGSLSGAYPKVKDAHDMLEAYAGAPMAPAQVQAVRKALADAAGSMDKSEARIGTQMLKDFDAQVHPFVPGLADARSTAAKYLNAETINDAIRKADPRSAQYSQSGLENALRTEFRQLDRKAIEGSGRYGDLVTGAVEDVSRGTPVSNAFRWAGKFAPRGVVSTGASFGLPFYAGSSVAGPAGGAIAGGLTMTVGELGKRAAEGLAKRQANVAELLARGGQTYADELADITSAAAIRGGHIGAGTLVPVARLLTD